LINAPGRRRERLEIAPLSNTYVSAARPIRETPLWPGFPEFGHSAEECGGIHDGNGPAGFRFPNCKLGLWSPAASAWHPASAHPRKAVGSLRLWRRRSRGGVAALGFLETFVRSWGAGWLHGINEGLAIDEETS
jgi:hypothetical protein